MGMKGPGIYWKSVYVVLVGDVQNVDRRVWLMIVWGMLSWWVISRM